LDIDAVLEKYEDQIDLFRKYQRYIYLGVSIILSIYLLVGTIFPPLDTYQGKKQELRAYKKALVRKQDEVLYKDHVEKELARLQEQLVKTEARFFSENEFNEFSINVLPKIASSFRNKVKSIHYRPVKGVKGKVAIYPLKIVIEGNFFGLINFFNELENFSKIVKVSNVKISRRSVSPLQLGSEFECEAYVYK